jgi:GNAT superfamily N-acetyltransferase
VEARRIDPFDDGLLTEWCDVLRASDEDLWPGLAGFTLPDIRAFARLDGTYRRFELVAAGEPGGPMLGVGQMELPLRDNLHSAEVTVAVHPAHRRRGAGTAVVACMSRLAVADGRRSLNSIVDVPVALAADHASVHFAPRVGFEAMLPGNTRHLAVPVDEARLDEVRHVVATARDAASYRTLTFVNPWPDEAVEDHCELYRRMSTDEPAGDGDKEEEVWDAHRLRENDELLAARESWKLVAVAQHIPSGRLVAFTELLLARDTPGQAWQMATLVHPEHRGHRLGLAIKIANLEFLAEQAPAVRLIVTGNAAGNDPMIAVNDMLGFEVAGVGRFWQKHLGGGA